MSQVGKIKNGKYLRPGDEGFDDEPTPSTPEAIVECDPAHLAHSLPVRSQIENYPHHRFQKNRSGQEVPVFHTKRERIEFMAKMRDRGYRLAWDQS